MKCVMGILKQNDIGGHSTFPPREVLDVHFETPVHLSWFNNCSWFIIENCWLRMMSIIFVSRFLTFSIFYF